MGLDGQAAREHRGHRRRDLHASPHVGGFGACGRLQRPAHRQPGFQEALPRRRAYRRLARQAGREDRQGGRKGPQTLRRAVRRGEIPLHIAPRGRNGGPAGRDSSPFRRGAECERSQGAAADHPRLRNRLPDFGYAQLDGGAAVQPDVLHADGLYLRRRVDHLPAARDGAGHFRQFSQRAEDRPHEAAVRHRADRQGVP